MRIITLLLLISAALSINAQNIKFSTYYEQRKSLFEMLPDTKGEIIFLGNSITDGGEWIELFNNKHMKNRGISGDISAGVLNRLPEITSSKPAKVFLLIGINDLARNISVDSLFQNIIMITTTIRKQSPKTKVYVQSILPVNSNFGMFRDHTNKASQIVEVNKLLVEWCNIVDIQYVDLYSRFKNVSDEQLNPRYTNDGLHLMGEGYWLWSEIIKHYFK